MKRASRVVLVTGGNSGIGLGIARAFVQQGAAVAIVARDAVKGDVARASLEALGGPVHFIAADQPKF